MLNKDFDVLNNWMFGSLNELLNGININSELDLIKMSIGEPQLKPPEFVQEELKTFSSDWGKYPPTVAIPRLKNSIINYLERRFPGTQNIIDPNNNILIDSDFNGEYEDNITEYTSNEIRFRFNPDTNSNLTYEFFSSKISGITFKHYYSTTTETEDSVFSPNVFVYDYKNDSDNDTNEDMYEIDSDDDGCNDVIEAGFDYSGFEGDADSDGILGNGLQTFDNGKIDERGKY